MPKLNSVILFVDMVGSTEFKYYHPDDVIRETVLRLFGIIRDCTNGTRAFIKFTGDGAMVAFDQEGNGSRKAILASESILQAMDKWNLGFDPRRAPIRIRIGLAAGLCDPIGLDGDLTGQCVDIAARLCADADVDTILLDEAVMCKAAMPSRRFSLCTRALSMKGVPIATDGQSRFFRFKPRRLLRNGLGDFASSGLLALYPDRNALSAEFTPARFIYLAAPDSTILVAGRTLIGWVQFAAEMRWASLPSKQGGKNLRFHFLVSSPDTRCYLDKEQKEAIDQHWPIIRQFFADLATDDPEHFSFRITDHLFLDGITCCRVILPGDDSSTGERAEGRPTKLLTLQDINAAQGDMKASLLFACTCNREDDEGDARCKSHGLLRRTRLIFERAAGEAPDETSALRRILNRHPEGQSVRKNRVSAYLAQALPHLGAIEATETDGPPPPLCVQIQISSVCSTNCVMCDHHFPDSAVPELGTDEWRRAFDDLADFGLRSVVLSGGEPLTREDLPCLLDHLAQRGIAIGMLTNGMMPRNDRIDPKRLYDSIRKNVDWIAVSIDGTPEVDSLIRNTDVKSRTDSLREFVQMLADGPSIAATITLQKKNIGMDFDLALAFIWRELGIKSASFKLATGAKQCLLPNEPDYLLSSDDIEDLYYSLWNDSVRDIESCSQNLSYLRRCFAEGIFNKDDIGAGSPIRSFYERRALRCFVPHLFAFIDSDGSVYPCCHLYRDNHGSAQTSKSYRKSHCMGNLKESGFEFAKIWKGEKFIAKREELKIIQPTAEPLYFPCGECSRFCQHNWALTEVYRAFEHDMHGLKDELERTGLTTNDPVWL